MSGTLPSSPAPESVEIRSVTSALVSQGQSMRRQSRTRGSQRWGLKFNYAPLTRAQWAPLFAFLVSQRGRYDSFQVVLPTELAVPLGSIPGSPVVDNEVGSPTELQTGRRTVNTSGWTGFTSSVLAAGDFIKFTGHTKVYMVTAAADSDSNGRAALSIEPMLLEGPAHGSAITVSSVPFTMALASDTLASLLEVNPQYGLSIDMIEAY